MGKTNSSDVGLLLVHRLQRDPSLAQDHVFTGTGWERHSRPKIPKGEAPCGAPGPDTTDPEISNVTEARETSTIPP